jgi:hypothetical protein
MASLLGAVLEERTATNTFVPPLTTIGEAMAKAKPKGKAKPKKVPFGGYEIYLRAARTRWSRCSAAPRCRRPV